MTKYLKSIKLDYVGIAAFLLFCITMKTFRGESAAYALLGWAVAQKSESKVNYLLIPLMLYEVDLFTPFALNNELLLGLINGSYNVAWGVEYPLAGQVIAILFPLIIAGGIFLSMRIKTKKE